VGDAGSVLRSRDFRRLLSVRLVGQASDGVFQVALASYVLFSPERQTTAREIAAAFAVVLLPYSVLGPFAGVLLDRWRRRQVLVLANVLRAALAIGVAGLVATGVDGAPFYAGALAVLSVNRFVLAGLSASLPHVASMRDLVPANALSTTAGALTALLGAGAGVAIRELLGGGDEGSAGIVLVTASLYVTAGLLALRLDRNLLGPDLLETPPQTREAVRHVARGLVDGIRHVWHRRAALLALAAITAHRFAYGISTVATILLYRNYFNARDDPDAGLAGLGIALAASGAGVLVAAIITPGATRRMGTTRWIVLLFTVAAIVQVVFGIPYTEPLLVVAAFLLGIVAQGTKICVDSIVQESVLDAYRGRVFAAYDMLFNVSFVGAAVFAAFVLPPSGKSYPVLFAIAAMYAVTALAYGLAARRPSARVLPASPPRSAAPVRPPSSR
jgi:MFS family permease